MIVSSWKRKGDRRIYPERSPACLVRALILRRHPQVWRGVKRASIFEVLISLVTKNVPEMGRFCFRVGEYSFSTGLNTRRKSPKNRAFAISASRRDLIIFALAESKIERGGKGKVSEISDTFWVKLFFGEVRCEIRNLTSTLPLGFAAPHFCSTCDFLNFQ